LTAAVSLNISPSFCAVFRDFQDDVFTWIVELINGLSTDRLNGIGVITADLEWAGDLNAVVGFINNKQVMPLDGLDLS
jgi:hypothetical protein